MANKIKESDLFEGDIFLQQKESVTILLKSIKELQAISKQKISLINPESAKDIKELIEEFQKLNFQREVSEKIKKKELATQTKQDKANQKELDSVKKKEQNI
jgi:hypothetical protein